MASLAVLCVGRNGISVTSGTSGSVHNIIQNKQKGSPPSVNMMLHVRNPEIHQTWVAWRATRRSHMSMVYTQYDATKSMGRDECGYDFCIIEEVSVCNYTLCTWWNTWTPVSRTETATRFTWFVLPALDTVLSSPWWPVILWNTAVEKW